MCKLNWKPANKRQQEQYWCGQQAMVARMNNVVLADRNRQVKLTLEIIVTGETVVFHYESQEYSFSFEKSVKGMEAGIADAEYMYSPTRYGETLIEAGYKEQY